MRAALLLCLALAACGGGGDAYVPAAPVAPTPNPKECIALQKVDGAAATCPTGATP